MILKPEVYLLLDELPISEFDLQFATSNHKQWYSLTIVQNAYAYGTAFGRYSETVLQLSY